MVNLIQKLIENSDFNELNIYLSKYPELSIEGIEFDSENTTKAHPLHRICDGVFLKKYTDEDAVTMARIFLKHGANINGGTLIEGKDTPLIAAASLHADKVALFYIENGAILNHKGCNGGTAMHWAAWCGRFNVVKALLTAGAEFNIKDTDHQATPLFWAILGSKHGGTPIEDSFECARLLIEFGANINIQDIDGQTVTELLNENHNQFKKLFNE